MNQGCTRGSEGVSAPHGAGWGPVPPTGGGISKISVTGDSIGYFPLNTSDFKISESELGFLSG